MRRIEDVHSYYIRDKALLAFYSFINPRIGKLTVNLEKLRILLPPVLHAIHNWLTTVQDIVYSTANSSNLDILSFILGQMKI